MTQFPNENPATRPRAYKERGSQRTAAHTAIQTRRRPRVLLTFYCVCASTRGRRRAAQVFRRPGARSSIPRHAGDPRSCARAQVCNSKHLRASGRVLAHIFCVQVASHLKPEPSCGSRVFTHKCVRRGSLRPPRDPRASALGPEECFAHPRPPADRCARPAALCLHTAFEGWVATFEGPEGATAPRALATVGACTPGRPDGGRGLGYTSVTE